MANTTFSGPVISDNGFVVPSAILVAAALALDSANEGYRSSISLNVLKASADNRCWYRITLCFLTVQLHLFDIKYWYNS